jgi:hypothetical protein
MKTVRRMRAVGSLCRQQAAYNSAQSWNLLAEAEYWEHLADAEMSSHFKECNVNLEMPVATPDANGTRWETVVAT